MKIIGDNGAFFDWHAARRGFDICKKRSIVILGIKMLIALYRHEIRLG